MKVVLDTNVLVVANWGSSQASTECVENSVLFLRQVQNEGCVSVDDANEIFTEYQRYANHSGQPGLGDAFFKWLFQNQGNVQFCEKVKTHPNGLRGFDEFPDSDDLLNFDFSDRKFVAVAIASLNSPTIYNAVDSDWKIFQAAFQRLNIPIRQLCS